MNIPFWIATLLVAVVDAAGFVKPFVFEINLDEPPDQRWARVAEAYADILPAMMLSFDQLLDSELNIDYKKRQLQLQHHNMPAEYIAELAGIVRTVGHELVTLDRLILFQLLYELSHNEASSGIVAVDMNGTVHHGCNFDSKLFFVGRGKSMDLEDVTLDLTWKRNGLPLFTSVNFVGQIGVHTGMTIGKKAWSVQQNLRAENGANGKPLPHHEIWSRTLNTMQAGGLPHMAYLRSLMESELGFKDAVVKLERAHLASCQYLLLAGSNPWDGAVIIVDRVNHTAEMNNVQVLSKEIGRWFLVQTNDNIWEDFEDSRRPEAVKLIVEYGQGGIDLTGVGTILRTWPMFGLDTVFTWLASPALGKGSLYMASESLDDFQDAGNRQKLLT